MAGLPLAAAHKAIDSRLIRPRATRSGARVRRLLTKEHLIFLQLEAEGLRLLPLGTRREIAESLRRSPKTDRLPVGEGTALSYRNQARPPQVGEPIEAACAHRRYGG
jgi:hypothetical protein